MTDAEFEAQRARIQERFDYWYERLWLGRWKIVQRYHRDDSRRFDDGDTGWSTLASVDAKADYLQATIEWNVAALAEWEPDQVEEDIVHEMCHILLAEITSRKPKPHERAAMERTVTLLARSFIETDKAIRKEMPSGSGQAQAEDEPSAGPSPGPQNGHPRGLATGQRAGS